jgi:hypothetical protein
MTLQTDDLNRKDIRVRAHTVKDFALAALDQACTAHDFVSPEFQKVDLIMTDGASSGNCETCKKPLVETGKLPVRYSLTKSCYHWGCHPQTQCRGCTAALHYDYWMCTIRTADALTVAHQWDFCVRCHGKYFANPIPLGASGQCKILRAGAVSVSEHVYGCSRLESGYSLLRRDLRKRQPKPLGNESM